nr:MAG: putative RNA-dependent RNA polymerase [Mitoviridae sp.]
MKLISMVTFPMGFQIRLLATKPVGDEAKYRVNGAVVTRTQVRAIDPLKRTVAEWQLLVDWDLHRTHNFIIIDPLNPEELLYLNRKEYLAHWKICASNELQLILIAQKGTVPPVPISSDPTDTSQNSPWRGGKFESKWSRNFRSTWKTFLLLRQNVGKVVRRLNSEPKMVSETQESVRRTVYAWASQLAHYTEVKDPGAVVWYFQPLANHLTMLLKTKGQMAVVQHLKCSLFALYMYIAGNPLKSTKPLGFGVRLTCGLPTIWPKALRILIRNGELPFIRITASLLNCYRAMEAEHGSFDLSTIVQEPKKIDGLPLFVEFQHFCKEVWPSFLMKEHKDGLPFWRYSSGYGLVINTAGANNCGSALGGIVRDAHAWADRPPEQQYAAKWFDKHNDQAMSLILKNAMIERHSPLTEGDWTHPTPATLCMATRDAFSRKGANPNWPTDADGWPKPVLGRLHAIDEPAGKVRIVAICDYFTQVACKPVHEFLFQILSGLETDATFDQTGRTEAYWKRGLYPHWSYDLKSATDLMPTSLYLEVLSPLLKYQSETLDEGRERVQLWLNLLTDREWLTPDTLGVVRYQTGQPMGALSSWASMALVHHAILQFSHWKSGGSNWFKDYLILGDDITIARKPEVASGYVAACDCFGIKIGLAKSMSSEKNFFEFANQRFCPEGNISPLSLREELSSTTWMARLEYARRILTRFGTHLKDETSALLRKVVTRSQWKVLIPELTHTRPSTYTALAKFCFLSPFVKEPRIETIVRWLAAVVPTEQRLQLMAILASPSQRAILLTSFVRILYYETLCRVKARLASAPPHFYVTVHKVVAGEARSALINKTLENEFSCYPTSLHSEEENRVRTVRMSTLLDDSIRGNFGYDPDEPAEGAPITMAYILGCINSQNDKTRTTLSYICYHLDDFYARCEETCRAALVDEGVTGVFGPLDNAIKLWKDAQGAPQFIIPDFSVSMAKWPGMADVKEEEFMGTRPKGWGQLPFNIKLERDHISAPLGALKLCLRQNFGMSIPEIPYMLPSKGGNWSKSIKTALTMFTHQNELTWEAIKLVELSWQYAEALQGSPWNLVDMGLTID